MSVTGKFFVKPQKAGRGCLMTLFSQATEVQPRWIQGASKVGGWSRRLWKNTYLITDIERLEMDSVVGRSVEKRRLNNLGYVK